MTSTEQRLDKKFQMLGAGRCCACCRMHGISVMSDREEYKNATGKKWPEIEFSKSSWRGAAATKHHIIHRNTKLTRWDWRNGLDVCPECHQRIHNEPGFNEWVEAVVIGAQKMDFLRELARPQFKLALLGMNLSEAEFWAKCERELDEQLKNDVRYFCVSADLPF